MDLNFFQSLIYGFLAGLSDILPVSAQAHKSILLKIFGQDSEPAVLRLIVHLAVFAALYYGCRSQIQRIMRQQRLAKIPKRRRKRPVDMRSIMDLRLLQTTLVPIFIGFLIHFKIASLESSLAWVAAFLVVNGVLLFLPALLPSGNKDSRSMTRVDGLLMGLGFCAAGHFFDRCGGVCCHGARSGPGLCSEYGAADAHGGDGGVDPLRLYRAVHGGSRYHQFWDSGGILGRCTERFCRRLAWDPLGSIPDSTYWL